jgi:hypothetical protein
VSIDVTVPTTPGTYYLGFFGLDVLSPGMVQLQRGALSLVSQPKPL